MINMSFSYTVGVEKESQEIILAAIRLYFPDFADEMDVQFGESRESETKRVATSYTITLKIKDSLLDKGLKFAIGIQPIVDLLAKGSFENSSIVDDIGVNLVEMHGDEETTTVLVPMDECEKIDLTDVEQNELH